MARSNKYSYNSIPNTSTDWALDPTNGKPFSGESVQKFIKQKLNEHDEKVGGVSVNGVAQEKDANGVVNINVPTVSQDLTNPDNAAAAQAGATAQELNAMKSQPFGSADTIPVEGDSTKLLMRFFPNGDNETPFATVEIPAAQEMGEVVSPKVTTELLTVNRIKQGDTIRLRWNYDCVRSTDGESTGLAALSVKITAKIGQTTVYEETRQNVPAGRTETVTLGPDVINQAGAVVITVTAQTEVEEELKTSTSTKRVTVVKMTLSSTFDPSAQLALYGGYANGTQVDVPYSFTGPSGTVLYFYVDGVQFDTRQIPSSALTSGHLYIPVTSDMAIGRHNLQIVADSDGLMSDVIYIDFLKAGGTAPYIGLKLMLTPPESIASMPLGYSGGVESSSLIVPAVQYEDLTFNFAAWNPDNTNTQVTIAANGIDRQTVSANRSLQTYSDRFDSAEAVALTFTAGATVRNLTISVSAAAGIEVEEKGDYQVKLTAAGRSNTEANPADWGGITTFRGVDWKTSGWLKHNNIDTLTLKNGAQAYIDLPVFGADMDGNIGTRGMTVEMEMMISSVLKRGEKVVSCLADPAEAPVYSDPKAAAAAEGMDLRLGLSVTTEEVQLHMGKMEGIPTAETETDEDGNEVVDDQGNPVQLVVYREQSLTMGIALDRWVKVAFVMQPTSAGRNMLMYINGVLSRASHYDVSPIQGTPVGITIDSTWADVRVRSVRIYREAIGTDDALNNFIVDRPTQAEIRSKYEENNVLTDEGVLDMEEEISRSRGVLVVVGTDTGGNGTVMDDLYRTNNKKADRVLAYVKWYSPLGRDYDVEAWNVYGRIQGTSSVKYPWKNLRIYWMKGPNTDAQPTMIRYQGKLYKLANDPKGKKPMTDDGEKFPGFQLRGPNSIPQSVSCAKTDFVDSSMVGNTGGATMFHDTMMTLGLLTPPQRYDRRVRQAIDGIPCDIFVGRTVEEQLSYFGQFVLNNEKSKSGAIFGMEGVEDSNGDEVDFRAFDTNGNPIMDMQPIGLEALTNSSPMTLFQSAGSADSEALANQLAADFDAGFEFNHPEDAVWATIGTGDYADWKDAQKSIKRLMGWIYDCMADTEGVKAGTMNIASPDYGTRNGWSTASKSKWVSAKFKREAKDYFNLDHLLTYYLITDYLASVDQRAKNIIWRTWDGLIWYSLFYDGDTWEGLRNDAFLVYLYNLTRDTYDDERKKYAYEGHDSNLWCLVLANLEEELMARATALRQVLSTERLNAHFSEMQANWSERQFNMSQMMKYVETGTYMYTLTGTREMHRTQFLTERGELLDARYAAGAYMSDELDFRMNRGANDAPDITKLVSGDLYYFGWNVNKNSWKQSPELANIGESLNMNFTKELLPSGSSSTSDPLYIHGASRMTELDFTGMNGHLTGDLNLSKCIMLSKLLMAATNGANSNLLINFGDIEKLEYIDLTGQYSTGTSSTSVLDVSKQGRLKTLLLGNTSIQQYYLAEGAPLTRLVLPGGVQWLTLRYLPQLTRSGLTLLGVSGISRFNFAKCPMLDWRELLAECPNVQYIRIEDVNEAVRAELLEQFMNKGGIAENGVDTTVYPVITGTVRLQNVISDERLAALRERYTPGGLNIIECQYTDYVFDDEETDPANITNEDNLTGYSYRDGTMAYEREHPNGYQASGHVSILHERCQPCGGYINATTHKMHVIPIKKSNFLRTKEGTVFDPTDYDGNMMDVFLYVPRYWYKGVNDFRHSRKHYLLGGKATKPSSTATSTVKVALDTLLYEQGKAVGVVGAVGQTFDPTAMLVTAAALSTYKVDVYGMKQVRFPGISSSQYAFIFTDENGEILFREVFNQQSIVINNNYTNPADFDNTLGDYLYCTVPDGARYLYFQCRNDIPEDTKVVIKTDSPEVEAIEPDWVEHLPELIGIYQGTQDPFKTGDTGCLRSISGQRTWRGTGTQTTNPNWQYDSKGNPIGSIPSGTMNGTAQDFYNLARIRNSIQEVVNGEYTTVPYETSKDMANVLMAWFGTRDVENIVGTGSSPDYTTGILNNFAFGDSTYAARQNKMWGLEAWTASVYEWTDKGCFNAPSFAAFLKAKRVAQTEWVVDYTYRILQQDGNERSVKAATANQASNVARTRFGRYCDIVASAYTGDTVYANCYACYQSSNSEKGRVLGRSSNSANANAGVAYSSTLHASVFSHASYGARLCFFGEIENEEELIAA